MASEQKIQTNDHFCFVLRKRTCAVTSINRTPSDTHEACCFCCASRWKICPYFWKRIRLRWTVYKENQLEAKQLPLKLACINSTKCTFQPALRERFIKEKDIRSSLTHLKVRLEDAELWALKWQVLVILFWTQQLACFWSPATVFQERQSIILKYRSPFPPKNLFQQVFSVGARNMNNIWRISRTFKPMIASASFHLVVTAREAKPEPKWAVILLQIPLPINTGCLTSPWQR